MQLLKGRPSDQSNRLEKEMRVYDLLDKLNIEYERVDHEPADTMEACKSIEQMLGVAICKNLFLCNRQKTAYYLLLMPADKPFKTKELSKQINSARLSFAGADDMQKFLDITPGSVSVIGLMNDIDNNVCLLIDSDLLQDEYIGFHPCINTSSVKASFKEILDKFLPCTNHCYNTVHLVGTEEEQAQ